MNYPTPYFKDIPKIGNLKIDYMILDSLYPVLFICADNEGNLYICDCCIADGEERRWLIAPATIDRLYQMFHNDITLRAMFDSAQGDCCLAIWKSDWDKARFEIIQTSEFPPEDLPTDECYLDSAWFEILDFEEYAKEREKENERY